MRAKAALTCITGLTLLVVGAVALFGPAALVVAGGCLFAFGLTALVFGGES